MLHYLRARKVSALRDMSDYEYRYPLRLSYPHHLVAAGAHLGHAARRGIKKLRIHGLDRVYYDEDGLQFLTNGPYILHIGLGEDEQIRTHVRADAVRPQLDLLRRLFARNIKDLSVSLRYVGSGLQYYRGLSDSWLARDQSKRTLHDAASEHPVEFTYACPETVCPALRPDILKSGRLRSLSVLSRPPRGCSLGRDRSVHHLFFNEGVPRSAYALAHPLRALVSALLTDEYRFCSFSH